MSLTAIGPNDILFPELSGSSLSSTLSSLKRRDLSIPNRLLSIDIDSQFVSKVAAKYGLPLIANERCGSWYVAPEQKAGSAYFKSTDGHTGQWSFSLRRLNLHVLDIIRRHNGCIIVDSTRRGKTMPDALSKTVPIWCAVLNRILFPEGPHSQDAKRLHTPRQVVSASEHAQIEARVPGFVDQLQELSEIIKALSKVAKPLRPIWVTRTDSELPSFPPSLDFIPVICCTSSKLTRSGEQVMWFNSDPHSAGGISFTYVQGAGDDSEAWACGLTPQVFWENSAMLLRTAEDDLPGFIARLMEERQSAETEVTVIPPGHIRISTLTALRDLGPSNETEGVIACSHTRHPELEQQYKGRFLHLNCREGKLGSRDLRSEFLKLDPYFKSNSSLSTVLICCSSGKDLSLGVCLAILCRHCSDQGEWSDHADQTCLLLY